MKIIIDTNILVSAIIRDNLPEQLILWLLAQPSVKWIATTEIIMEYLDVLQRKKFDLPADVVAQWRCLFDEQISLVTPAIKVSFPRDRKDAKFLECALACEADVFVTGDKDFSEAQVLICTQIMTVTQFKLAFMG
ncbi:MAG: putative toxin-antitoxin system toxin component, PIN family [Methylobacter sp.]|nr:MAG: putative toxin-antitoxin system toxin component, PIN family [Methylobacter sp.]